MRIPERRRGGIALDSSGPVPVPVTTNQSRKTDSDKQVLGRTEWLVELMRETGVALTGRHLPSFPGERVWTLIALDDPGVWEGVADEAEWENYLAGGPEPKHWRPRPKKPLLMRPPVFSRDGLSLEEALNRLERVRASGRGRWRARCPLPHSRRDSFLIVGESDFKPGEPVFFCYAGCTHQAVKDALLERVA